ncbi:hypothetical protein MLD38_032716 [Melastoma candidum]|uniref:Uncharacterized protein n=1 Tax=Melastoma candidum TaxID=119954 RepID=A0ACB9M511_9MYRT|nr:hypothetical protein MLD38_032716 [Melastoma candidum]
MFIDILHTLPFVLDVHLERIGSLESTGLTSISGSYGGFTVRPASVYAFDRDLNPNFVHPPYDLERRAVLCHGVSVITSRDVGLAQALGKSLRLFYHRLVRREAVESPHCDAADRPLVWFQVQFRERRGWFSLEFRWQVESDGVC